MKEVEIINKEKNGINEIVITRKHTYKFKYVNNKHQMESRKHHGRYKEIFIVERPYVSI